MDHPHNFCMALQDAGQHTAADGIKKGLAAGIPWKDLISAFVSMALPTFLAWIQQRIHPQPPAA